MTTLFSLLNGDVMRESFLDLYSINPLVSQVYIYTFVSFFIYVVRATPYQHYYSTFAHPPLQDAGLYTHTHSQTQT
jgi:hypothetical protein